MLLASVGLFTAPFVARADALPPVRWARPPTLNIPLRNSTGSQWDAPLANARGIFQPLAVGGRAIVHYNVTRDGNGCDSPAATIRLCAVSARNTDGSPAFTVRITVSHDQLNRILNGRIEVNRAVFGTGPLGPLATRALCRGLGRTLGLPARPADPATSSCMAGPIRAANGALTIDQVDINGLSARYGHVDATGSAAAATPDDVETF